MTLPPPQVTVLCAWAGVGDPLGLTFPQPQLCPCSLELWPCWRFSAWGWACWPGDPAACGPCGRPCEQGQPFPPVATGSQHVCSPAALAGHLLRVGNKGWAALWLSVCCCVHMPGRLRGYALNVLVWVGTWVFTHGAHAPRWEARLRSHMGLHPSHAAHTPPTAV
jgi:hypothetical protein